MEFEGGDEGSGGCPGCEEGVFGGVAKGDFHGVEFDFIFLGRF